MTEQGQYPLVNLNYQKDLDVDQHNLELEWVRQASLMDRYSIIHAQAIFDRNRADDRVKDAEANLKRIFAELDGEARGPVLPEGLAKQVDAAVKEWTIRHPHYQKAQEELAAARGRLSEAQYVVDVMFGAVMAFQAKKMALENLVRLFGMKYYAEPYEPPGSDIRPQALERGRMAITETMRKPEIKYEPMPPPCKPPAPGSALSRDKDGHRYAVGPIEVHVFRVFTAGPFSELQYALDYTGDIGQGIYRLTMGQPDELIFIWISDASRFGWDEVSDNKPEAPKTPSRPPQRPLPKRQ